MATGSNDMLMAGVTFLTLAVTVVALYAMWPRPAKIFLDKKRKKAQILDIVSISHDVKRFRLCIGGKGDTLGLPVGKHIKIFAPNVQGATPGHWNGKDDREKDRAEIERNYTPVSLNDTKGQVDLIIKMYRAGKVKMANGEEIMWEDGGKMTKHLDTKKPGDFLELMGPVGIHEYLGNGTLKVPGQKLVCRHIGMIAGGAGITPMLQLVSHALRDAKDGTCFTLLYANKSEDDILCREQLEELEKAHPTRFTLAYTLDFPPASWAHKRGFVTQDMIKELFPPPSESPIFCLCGPPPMVDFACKKNLEALGYPKDTVFAW